HRLSRKPNHLRAGPRAREGGIPWHREPPVARAHVSRIHPGRGDTRGAGGGVAGMRARRGATRTHGRAGRALAEPAPGAGDRHGRGVARAATGLVWSAVTLVTYEGAGR